MLRAFPSVGLMVLLPGVLLGQPTTNPVFEVADVHVSAPGAQQTGGFMPGGRVEVRGFTMLELITAAYDVEPEVVVGGPSWLNTDKFDVIAKAPPTSLSMEAMEPTLQAMLKALLADRFKLVAREEKKDMPVYVLTVGKSGPKLQPAANPGPPKESQGQGDPSINNHRKFESCTMAYLAERLHVAAKNFVDHPVVDETGLTGVYDFQLDWMGMAPYRQAKANPEGPKPFGAFDGVEKLGLHLEAGKRPLPVIVVESVNETPTPNAAGVTAKIPTFPTEFDVAEVRPAKPTAPPAGQAAPAGPPGPLGRPNIQNGRVEFMGATLKGLITLAYDTTAERIASAPKWMDEDRFDVIAKAGATVPFDALRVMLKNLIVQRFKLVTHTEDQPMLVYVLEAGKKPKLKESDGSARSDCTTQGTVKGRTFTCQNTTMAQFAERVPPAAGAYITPPLLDLTGIKGAYDFELYWTPKAQLQNGATKGGDPSQASLPVNELTIFEAVDKQLGLKIEQQKHPIPMMVIDKVKRTPSEN